MDGRLGTGDSIEMCISNATSGQQERQRGVVHATAQQGGRAPEAPERALDVLREDREIVGPAIGQRGLGQAVHAFVGIELRGVRREADQVQAPRAPQPLPQHLAGVRTASIPQDHQRAAEVPHEGEHHG